MTYRIASAGETHADRADTVAAAFLMCGASKCPQPLRHRARCIRLKCTKLGSIGLRELCRQRAHLLMRLGDT